MRRTMKLVPPTTPLYEKKKTSNMKSNEKKNRKLFTIDQKGNKTSIDPNKKKHTNNTNP